MIPRRLIELVNTQSRTAVALGTIVVEHAP